MEIVREFKKLRKEDVAIAGGKGASLGEMTQAGMPVPEGFVVLSEAFENFIKETDLNIEIDAVLDTVKHEEVHTVEKASEKIQALILNAEMSKETETNIVKFFDKLGAKFVAVRSSATSEDSASDSWAGQLDTFLNVTKENLLDNVKKCWASLFTPRAIVYRFDKNLHETNVSVAVVVQKMINSEESGIAFSVHPVTQDKNQLIIEAGFGLGESIVSGQITPDSYVVDKQDKHIIDINVNEQEKGLFRKKDGGNEWKEVGKKSKKQVLNEKEISKLSKIVINIEEHYGFPVDIEWAKEKGKFYITQSRPITTLIKSEVPEENGEIKWIKEGEMPLDENKTLFLLTDILLSPVISEVEKRTGISEGVISYIDREEKVNKIYTSQDKKRGEWGFEFFLNDDKFNRYLNEVKEVFIKSENFRKKIDKIDLEKASLSEIKEIFSKDIGTLWQSKVLVYFTIDPYSWKIEESLKENLLKIVPKKEFENVLGTLVLQEEKDALENERHSWLKNMVLPAFKKGMKFENVKRDDYFLKKIKEHLNTYKSYSAGLGMKMWDIEYYLSLLKEDLNKNKKELKEEFLSLENKCLINKKKKKEIIKKFRIPSESVKKASILGKLSNLRLDLRVMSWSFYIHVLIKLLEVCSRKSGLSELEINSLTYDEFMNLLNDDLKINKELKQKIEKRKSVNIIQLNTPKEGFNVFLGKEAKKRFYLEVGQEKKLKNAKSFKGDVACRKGIVRGEVFIFKYGSSDFVKRISQFPKGAILVANLTMPILMPAIRKAKAMVTDSGGITCHSAIVSREFGIPCIIGTNIATKVLKDGDLIEVDTDKGVVKIIKKA